MHVTVRHKIILVLATMLRKILCNDVHGDGDDDDRHSYVR
jgi:hypothetical protein